MNTQHEANTNKSHIIESFTLTVFLLSFSFYTYKRIHTYIHIDIY